MKQKAKPKKGDRIEYAGAVFVVQGDAGPRRGIFVTLENHAKVYRLPARALQHVTIV